MWFAVVAGGVILLMLFWVVGLYNRLVRLRNAVRNAWSQIDVQLKRRYDLIPNLVETVRGYMTHERETLEAVTRARNLARGAAGAGVADRAQAEGQLSRALMNLFAVAEQYPDLKANQNFMALQEELVSTENRIGFARQAYNDAVMTLNNAIQMFPANLFVGVLGFKEEAFFQVDIPEERQAPKVSFSR